MNTERECRARLTAVVLGAALALGAAASAQDAPDDHSFLTIYDVRDLMALPLDAGRAAPAATVRAAPGGGFGSAQGGGGARPPHASPAPTAAGDHLHAAERLVTRLADAQGLSYDRLLEGLFAVQGFGSEHEEFRRNLELIRDLYSERYEVCLVCYTVDRDGAPRIGAAARPAAPWRAVSQVVLRRHPTPVRAVKTLTYVADVAPIIGNGAMGYDPTTATVDDGLAVMMVVGAGDEDEARTLVQVEGELTCVTMGKVSGPLGGRPDTGFTIDLPVVDRRSVHASLLVPFGTMTVVGVHDGFTEGDVTVVAVEVRKLD